MYFVYKGKWEKLNEIWKKKKKNLKNHTPEFINAYYEVKQ